MAKIKGTFARIKGVDAGGLQALAARLKKIVFNINCDEHLLGIDLEGARLNVEVAVRRKNEVQGFDEAKGQITQEERYAYRTLYFNLDARAGIVSTPGARRELTQFADLLKRAGQNAVDLVDLNVDLFAWAPAIMQMYDTAQLSQLVIDKFYTEPKLLGRYSAKSVDNRLELKALADLPGHLRSLRLSFYHYDTRRSVEVRSDGVLAVTSSDDQDVEHFFSEQRGLLLKHASVSAPGED